MGWKWHRNPYQGHVLVGIQAASVSPRIVTKQRKTFRKYYKAPNQVGSLVSPGPDLGEQDSTPWKLPKKPKPKGACCHLGRHFIMHGLPESPVDAFPAASPGSQQCSHHQQQATSSYLVCPWTYTFATKKDLLQYRCKCNFDKGRQVRSDFKVPINSHICSGPWSGRSAGCKVFSASLHTKKKLSSDL